MQAFEERVKGTALVTWEGDRLFQGEGELNASARRLAKTLEERQIPYLVVGGFALIKHGYERYTQDLDFLVTPDGLKRIHAELVGLGYRPLFAGSKNIRDAQNGVRIDLLVSGGYPGDGKPKPIAFPDPTASAPSTDPEGVRFVDLKTFIELKIASAMTGGPGRAKDLTDAYELVRVNKLGAEFAAELNPYVREKFDEILEGIKQADARGDHEAG